MTLEDAMRYPAALDVVRKQAKEARENSTSYGRNPRWWQFLWPRPALRERIRPLSRFIAGTATAKRILFVWCEPSWAPSNLTNVFALDSDYAFGVLTSRIHSEWAAKKSSTLEDRIRYTPSSAFETFPWPQAAEPDRDRIAEAARIVVDLRATLCSEHQIGLGRLYDRMEEGAYAALNAAHRELDLAVISAYGWPSALLDDTAERNRRLYDVNAAVVADPSDYAPF